MVCGYLKLFVDCLEKYRKLNDAEFGRLIRAALTYKRDGVEMELNGREELLWDGMKLDIDRDNEAYKETVASRSEAGKKGAAARWQNDGKNGKCHLPYGKNGQDKEEDKDKDKEEDKDKHNARGAFDVFWSSYPKKVGKEAARKSFKKVDVPVETLVAAVEMQKRSAQWKKDKGRYIPNPATWLNQGRWDDEVEVETVGRTEGNPEKVKYGNYV